MLWNCGEWTIASISGFIEVALCSTFVVNLSTAIHILIALPQFNHFVVRSTIYTVHSKLNYVLNRMKHSFKVHLRFCMINYLCSVQRIEMCREIQFTQDIRGWTKFSTAIYTAQLFIDSTHTAKSIVLIPTAIGWSYPYTYFFVILASKYYH